MPKDIYILDPNKQSVFIIEDYSSFIWTKRYNAAGDFEIECPVTSELVRVAIEDNYVWYGEEPTMLMYIDEVRTTTSADSGDILLIRGKSIEMFLDRRIIWNQTIFKGTQEAFVQKLLNDSCINPTKASRKIPGLSYRASGMTTDAIDIQMTGYRIYDAVRSVCALSDLGFRITFEGEQFIFQLYKGVDRSYDQDTTTTVIFSDDYDNLLTTEMNRNNINYRDVALVAGEGEGVERKLFEVDKGQSGLNRRETFVDARDISSTTEDDKTLTASEYNALLQQRGEQQLAEMKVTSTFESEVEPNISFTYGVDYFLGDIVQIENKYGQLHKSRIDEVVYSMSASDGEKVIPKFRSLDVVDKLSL